MLPHTTNQPKQKNRKFRLQTILIIPFVLQIAAAVSLVGWLSFRNSQQAIDDIAIQLNKEIGTRIEQYVLNYLNQSANLHRQMLANVKSGNLKLDDFAGLQRYFWELVKNGELQAYVSYGNEEGEFVGVEYQEDGTVQLKIRTKETEPIRETYLLDNQLNREKLLKQSEYDPRTRPWYKAAKDAGQLTWSPIYPFFSRENTVLGISPTQPIYDETGQLIGVLNINITLNRIADFLKNLYITPNGQSFIMERNGDLVVSSQIIQPFIIKGNGENREIERLDAANSPNLTVRETARYLQNNYGNLTTIYKPQKLKIKIKQEWNYVEVFPIQDGYGIDWLAVVAVPESDFMEQINRKTNKMIILCLATLVITIGLGIFTSRWIVRPILQVSQASQEIATGNLDQQIQTSQILEIDNLANSFNSMAKQLKESFATLEKQNEDLKRLDQLKDEFLANTSHELRTPLNGIIGIAESLNDGATGQLPETTRTNLSLIISSGRRLSRLINDILDFSKLKHKTLELKHKPVDLRAITQVVLTLSQPLAAQKKLQLINNISPELPPAEADEDRLQQILHNLIANAIKFTPAGTIEISAQLVTEEPQPNSEHEKNEKDAKNNLYSDISNNKFPFIAITISDTGIGIAEDKFERIFESFEQAEGSTAREYGGTGLGLAVTKTLVELHGGQINVQSKIGVGSQFTFTLPVSQNQLDTSQEKPTIPDNLNLEKSPKILLINSPSNSSEGKQFKLLIVDDEPINRQVLVNNLSLCNYQIAEASNGQEALSLIENGLIPDLILLDVMMPKMTGYEVSQKIRDHFPAYELPIVMLTAKNQVSDIVEGFAAGANDYLTKPIQKQEMLARIKTHLHLAKLTTAYGRFVPRNFLKFLEKESIIDVQLGDQVQQQMTVMFSDIRSFTTLSEGMSPQENFDFINAYLSRVSPLIRQHNGFIDKYIGDAIMALFPESANDAVEAAIAMQKTVTDYNQQRHQQGYLPLAIGIGLHTGNLMLGTIGESERMETTVIADAVNLASRLEGLTKLYGVGILISHKTLCYLNYEQEHCVRFLDRVNVKGKKTAIAVFEVFDGDPETQKNLKKQTQARFEIAVFLYYQKQFEEAEKIMDEVLEINPQDKAAMLYIKRCQHYQQFGLAEDWAGVTELDFK